MAFCNDIMLYWCIKRGCQLHCNKCWYFIFYLQNKIKYLVCINFVFTLTNVFCFHTYKYTLLIIKVAVFIQLSNQVNIGFVNFASNKYWAGNYWFWNKWIFKHIMLHNIKICYYLLVINNLRYSDENQ